MEAPNSVSNSAHLLLFIVHNEPPLSSNSLSSTSLSPSVAALLRDIPPVRLYWAIFFSLKSTAYGVLEFLCSFSSSSPSVPVLLHLGAYDPLHPLFLSCEAPLHSITYSVFSILMMMPAGRVYFMHNSRALRVGGSQAGTHLKASTAASAPMQH